MTTGNLSINGSGSPGGTPTVNLNVPLYTIETRYYDPIKKSNELLPQHYWSLYNVDNPATVIASSVSTAAGVCTIMKPTTPLAKGEYGLALYPFPNDVRAAYLATKWAWIDLTTNQWVTPPPPAGPRIDRRKLVCVPFWNTPWKAQTYGGGF